jgi:hypothetical protein
MSPKFPPNSIEWGKVCCYKNKQQKCVIAFENKKSDFIFFLKKEV